jgi:hypothetical protein
MACADPSVHACWNDLAASTFRDDVCRTLLVHPVLIEVLSPCPDRLLERGRALSLTKIIQRRFQCISHSSARPATPARASLAELVRRGERSPPSFATRIAGIDGPLRLAAEWRGEETAQAIQLQMPYAAEPPFNSGRPETAPVEVLKQVRRSVGPLRRSVSKRRVDLPPNSASSFELQRNDR